VFDDAREQGFNTAVVAWAVPYCRVIGHSLTGCWWWSASNQYNSTGTTVTQIFENLPRGLFETMYRSPFGQSLPTVRHESTYEGVLEQSKRVVANRHYGLTLLHFPIPHPPYFYDAASRRFTWGDQPVSGFFRQNQQGYIPALALADRTIGEIRREMEQEGLWDSTTILFTADHPFRERPSLDGHPVCHSVPFLLKIAGEREGLHYARPFSSLATKELILAVLHGSIGSPAQAARWLDGNAASVEE
jgi:hypothetical protein